MSKSRRVPKVKGDIPAPVLNQELGIPNFAPTTSWQSYSPEIPKGAFGVGRDPLAPNLNELIFMLRRDGQARAMLELLTLPIRSAFAKSQWIDPDSSGDEAKSPEAVFANNMWSLPPQAGGMAVPKSMFLRQTLLALAHGFAPFEIVKSYREEGPLAGKYVIDKMAYRDGRTVTMLADDHGSFKGFRQQARLPNRLVDKVIKSPEAWYFAANEEHNPLYGVSYFEPAFQHYQAKRKLYYISEVAAQLAAVPGRVGELAPGASPRQIMEFKKALAEFHFNQSMMVPPNFKVTPVNANTGFDPVKIIDHHNAAMVKSILAGFLQQDDRLVLIDNGKADASADLFVSLLEAITYELAESYTTRLMPQFIDYNFGSGNYPIFKFAPLTDTERETITNLFTTMVGLQTLNASPEFVRCTEMDLAERLGYPIDYEAVAEQEAQAAEAAQKQAAEEAAAQAELQKAQLESIKAGTKAQAGVSGGGTRGPAPGTAKSQGANKVEKGRPTPAPTPAGGRPPTETKPATLRASAELNDHQQEAVGLLATGLSMLLDNDDVPSYYAPEGEILPEELDDILREEP